eukprot:COSAG05_NODE_15653_length_364_cov_1.143396_1_plen_66_part_01
MAAASRGEAECARLLLEAAGADASLRGKDSRTALEHAEARGHAEVAALLRGASPTAVTGGLISPR